MTWEPQFERGGSPLYLSLVHAIERDAKLGLLRPGDRLPTQRDLAYSLSIGVGTVTRAYEEAERRGLVTAHVGRGSFIADRSQASASFPNDTIDLSVNQMPLERANAELRATLRDLARRGIGSEITGYASPVGTECARKAGAAWMSWSGRVTAADWRRIACTVGAQQAMDQAFAALAAPGESILCEDLTYWGAKALARYRGNELHGVAMDEQGLRPDSLQRAVNETGARVVYCTPTLQNPTATIMGAGRRAAIAALARKLDIWLIEDDVYAHYAASAGLEPLVNLAPERTIYLTSLSKAVLPGLRAGYLLAPNDQLFDRIATGLRATVCTPPGLSRTIATEWIGEGRAQEIAHDALSEITRRTTLGLRLLDGIVQIPGAAASLHLWLPMDELACERATSRAGHLKLLLPDPDTPRVGATSPCGLRISIGAPSTIAALEGALKLLREAIIPSGTRHDRAVV